MSEIAVDEAVRLIESTPPTCEQCRYEHQIGRRRFLCRSCLILVEYRDQIIINIRKASK